MGSAGCISSTVGICFFRIPGSFGGLRVYGFRSEGFSGCRVQGFRLRQPIHTIYIYILYISIYNI